VAKSIWLICKYASPERYFFGTRHFYFSEEWVKNGFEVTIFTSNSSHLTDKLPQFKRGRMLEEINGVKTVWLKVLKTSESSSVSRVLSWIHFEWKVLTTSKRHFKRPDVIIASSLSILSIISGYILSRFYKARFILEIRDIWPLSAMQLGGYSSKHPFIWFLSKLERFGYQKADVIVGTMPNLIEHVKNVEPRFSLCTCIPQGITEQQLSSLEPLSSEYIEYIFTPNTFKVVYAGTLNANNPIEVLLQSIERLPDHEPIEAYILGAGSMLEFYKKKYSNCKRIKFISQIPKKNVKDFLQHTDLCFDSVDSEIAKYGLSRNKWIDYMNAGRPIICSYNGYQSMINEAGCGSFVEFGNIDLLSKEILRFKNMSKEERKLMGERARDYLIKYRLFSTLAIQYQSFFSTYTTPQKKSD
jgi:glycosyltransferase involved in cell wall biosynthesis